MRVRTQARRDGIVEAAAELFEEMGYEAASMSELAKRLGGSKATLYGYFTSKEALLVAVVEAFATAHLADAMGELVDPPKARATLRSTLTRFGERMLQVLTNDKRAMAVYRMVVAASGRSDVGQLFHDAGPKQTIEALAALLGAAIERGELRPADATLRARQLLSLLTAEVDARQFQQAPPMLSPEELKQMVGRAVEMFLLGAATP